MEGKMKSKKLKISKSVVKEKEARLYELFGYRVVYYADAKNTEQMVGDVFAYEAILSAM
jgi:hypothetical protein